MQPVRLPGLLLLAAVLACTDADPFRPSPQSASVLIANLAFGTSGVDVTVSGVATPLATGLDFGEYTSTCVAVPAGGPVQLTFRSSVGVLATPLVSLAEDERYMLLLTNDGAGADAILMGDDVAPPGAGERAVRIVNATTAPVDAYMFAEGAGMGAPLASAAEYVGDAGEPPQYITRPANENIVRFFPAGASEGEPLAEESLQSRNQAPLITLVLSETAAGSDVFPLRPCA